MTESLFRYSLVSYFDSEVLADDKSWAEVEQLLCMSNLCLLRIETDHGTRNSRVYVTPERPRTAVRVVPSAW